MSLKLSFKHLDEKIEFELIYRDRKSICLTISPNNEIVVHAPRRVKPDEVMKFVESKARWISRKLHDLKEVRKNVKAKQFVDGEKILFLGEEHHLQVVFNPKLRRPNISIDYGKIIFETCSDKLEENKFYFEYCYKEKALDIISERVLHYKKILNVKPNNVKVREQKSRWGTCNSKGNLNFNWKIIMAPLEIVDYLVVHEMAHLVHLNHSSKFWALVENVLPDYEIRRKNLKKLGPTYTF